VKLSNKLLFTLAFYSLSVAHVANAANDQMLTYKNQRGSKMTLIFHQGEGNTGTLEGTFTTAVGECKKDVGVPLPLSGYYNGNAIAVTVNFPHCKQVVAMTGNFLDGQNQIQTLWLDASQSKDPRHKDWNSNIIGTDFYNKVRNVAVITSQTGATY
jgi:Avidin family